MRQIATLVVDGIHFNFIRLLSLAQGPKKVSVDAITYSIVFLSTFPVMLMP